MFEFVFNLLKIKKNYKNNETEKADEIINEIVTIKQNIPAPEYDKCKQFMPLQHGEIAYCSSVYDGDTISCLLYTSPSPRDKRQSRMPSSA